MERHSVGEAYVVVGGVVGIVMEPVWWPMPAVLHCVFSGGSNRPERANIEGSGAARILPGS